MVLGATNRPNDIDPAILRRMPKRFAIRLPDREQRKTILNLVRSPPFLEPQSSAKSDRLSILQMLSKTSLSSSLDVSLLAARTEGFSGSDLQELCRNAAMVPVKEFMRSPEGMQGPLGDVSDPFSRISRSIGADGTPRRTSHSDL